MVYVHALNEEQQQTFEALVRYFDHDLSKYLPLSFLLGFFVSQVVGRWNHITEGIGWIDNSAINFANFIHGKDEDTRLQRRSLVRYMVLNQALVLRDISMQVRKRFPTLESLIAAGLLTTAEKEELENEEDIYTRYWIPLHWCYCILQKARNEKKIESDHLLVFIVEDIQHFREGLSKLLKFDWIPIPLVYPQVVFLAVRIYFAICLISRQYIKGKETIDIYIPLKTMIEFFVYMGWMKVAEALLNPLGEDDDDLEVNSMLDKNLITGMALVDKGQRFAPPLVKDKYWSHERIDPLYSLSAAKRSVHPLTGSAANVNLVKDVQNITMIPHKSRLSQMDETTRQKHIKVVSVEEHNQQHKQKEQRRKDADPDDALAQMRRRSRVLDLFEQNTSNFLNVPASARSLPTNTEMNGRSRAWSMSGGLHRPSANHATLNMESQA
ncbi:unnamed protein product [Bursaphelenchus okinawaensis]|uniref:Bestrophin homolog n=1 Tax=Bursaphelenchus okinawaensis TaxID=465554 RepID=A0A811KYV8_9BILA|nr:unnamed protein product [Bursaphelenchus okinawaensis]CAG9114495.1 unnamed protein product [Bursaphelenchus okinawaensis]